MIKKGLLSIQLTFDKSVNVSTMIFDIEGKISTTCDRCTAEINLPIVDQHSILLKLGEEKDSTDEVMYIHPETSELNLSQIIYEFIVLSVPIMKVYDCEYDEPLPCNASILDKLDASKEENKGSSIWDDLKGLDLNN